MKSVFRYFLRQLFEATVFVTIVFACIIWLAQSLRFVELIINRGLSLGTFLYLTSLLLPTFLTIILPIALFVAIMFVYFRLTMDSELVVLRAVGVSHAGLARPALLLALLVTLLCYSLNIYFVPAAFRQFKDLEFTIRNDYSAALLQEGVFNTLTEGLTVYVRARNTSGEMSGILVHDNREPRKPITMMAEQGLLVSTDEGPRVVMINGNRQEVERESGRLSLLYFDRYTFDLGQFATLKKRWREPRERFLHELFYTDGSENDRYYEPSLRAEGHQRLAFPLYGIAFALVGLAALLSGDFNRRGQVRRVLVAIAVIVLLLTAALGLQQLAKKFPESTPLMYVNSLIPIVAGLYVLMRAPRRRRPAASVKPAAAQGWQ